MKTLHLIRHAKSSWLDDSQTDHQRPINRKGQQSCVIMAAKISAAEHGFPNIYCSSANRAQQTIRLLSQAHQAASDKQQWQTDESLYTFNHQNLSKWVKSLDDSLDQVTVIGHNPAMTDFINRYSRKSIPHLPTCGYVKLECNFARWRDIQIKAFTLVEFIYPKMFPTH